MGITREKIVEYVGSRVNQWDGSKFVDGKLTEQMLHDAIQNRYDELFSHLAKNFREDFTRETDTNFGPSYDDATATGVYDLSAILDNSHVLLWVGVKYATSDTDFTHCERREYNDLFQTGSETYSQNDPKYAIRTITVSGSDVKGLEIFPHNTDTDVTSGLRIRDIERPPRLSGSVNVSDAIPAASQWYIGEGALIDAYQILGGDYKGMVPNQMGIWEMYKNQAVSDYIPKTAGGPARVRTSRHIVNLRKRRY